MPKHQKKSKRIRNPPSELVRKHNREYQKVRYHQRRMAVIAHLGGVCQYPGCTCTDPEELEIHHVNPVLYSVKGNGKPRGIRAGESRIREWDDIIAGKKEAKILCHHHHHKVEHEGNPCALKKQKVSCG